MRRHSRRLAGAAATRVVFFLWVSAAWTSAFGDGREGAGRDGEGAASAAEAKPEGGASRGPAEEHLSAMSLEELLNVKVFLASKRDERVSDAPAATTAYLDRDLRALGYYTLGALADLTAGYSTYVVYGERVFATRGQKAGSFNNNKHLLYVDGIPVNHARNFKAPADEELPLFFARRVEFLRGPASALYGTSAFFGVISIVPKSLEREGTLVEGRVGAGTRDGERRIAANFLHRAAAGEARVSVGYYEKQASRDFVGTSDDPANLFWDDQKSAFVNVAYQSRRGPLAGLGAGLVYMRKNGGLGEHWMEAGFSHELNDLTWETVVPYLRYDHQVGDSLQISGYLLENVGREKGWWSPFTRESFAAYDGTGEPFQAYDTEVRSVESLVETRWNITERLSLVAGIDVETRRQAAGPLSYGFAVSADPGEPYVPNATLAAGSGRYTTYSAYALLRRELPVLDGLVLTLGAREDYGTSPGQRYDQLSPRFGLVQKVGPSLTLRAFYGSALRAPGLKEVELNNESREVLQRAGLPTDGIRPLRAETIRSVEIGAAYHIDRLALSVSGFGNRTSNALDGRPYNNVNIFANAEGVTDAVGLEVEARYATSEDFRMFANYAWARAEDPEGRELHDVPVQSAALGVTRRFRSPLDVSGSFVARWVDAYRVPGGATRPVGGLVADANLVAALGGGLDLEARLSNVTDRRLKLPKNGLPDVPLPGRSLLVTLVYGF